MENLPSSIPLVSSPSYGKSSFCFCKETIFGIISIARAARLVYWGILIYREHTSILILDFFFERSGCRSIQQGSWVPRNDASQLSRASRFGSRSGNGPRTSSLTLPAARVKKNVCSGFACLGFVSIFVD